MVSDTKRVAVIGLPGVGKTTFLAALWDVVGSGEVVGSLQLDRLEGDKHHLNEIRNRWADCLEIERTKIPDETLVSMQLKDVQNQTVNEIVFTDMSGESFEQQWNERSCKNDYRDLITGVSGILLLIHPRKVKEAILIRDAAKILEMLPKPAADIGQSHAGSVAAQAAAAKPLPTEPHYASTQVQLVDLLQFVREIRAPDAPRLKLAIIISAWDVVESLATKATRVAPQDWFRKRLPLLDQFVRANPELFDNEVFGISAQGGELTEADKLRMSSPSDRISVVRGKQRSHDITLPVRWVLDFPVAPAGNQ
jgi:hypothetical protein